MTKRKVFSSWSLYCLSFPLRHCIVLSFPIDHCMVYLFLLVIVLSVFSSWCLYCLSFPFGHCIVCLFLLVIVTDNTMIKSKRQTIQWPRGKDRQYNDQEEETDNTMTSSWSLYCLSFPLGHYIVCLFLLVMLLSLFSSWSLYCLSFPLGHCIVCLFLLVIVLSVSSSWSLY
jgi:hypothetical protein